MLIVTSSTINTTIPEYPLARAVYRRSQKELPTLSSACLPCSSWNSAKWHSPRMNVEYSLQAKNYLRAKRHQTKRKWFQCGSVYTLYYGFPLCNLDSSELILENDHLSEHCSMTTDYHAAFVALAVPLAHPWVVLWQWRSRSPNYALHQDHHVGSWDSKHGETISKHGEPSMKSCETLWNVVKQCLKQLVNL